MSDVDLAIEKAREWDEKRAVVEQLKAQCLAETGRLEHAVEAPDDRAKLAAALRVLSGRYSPACAHLRGSLGFVGATLPTFDEIRLAAERIAFAAISGTLATMPDKGEELNPADWVK